MVDEISQNVAAFQVLRIGHIDWVVQWEHNMEKEKKVANVILNSWKKKTWTNIVLCTYYTVQLHLLYWHQKLPFLNKKDWLFTKQLVKIFDAYKYWHFFYPLRWFCNEI